MHTTVFLIRNAETPWNAERRLAGRRELGLSEAGLATARALADRFTGLELQEILSSPLPRAVETAQPLAQAQGLELARDPRLSDWQAGAWEGVAYDQLAATPHYAEIMSQPMAQGRLPDGERFADIVARMSTSIRQALEDNELGSRIAIVSHAGPLCLLLSHYQSIAPCAPCDHGRMQLAPGAITELRFSGIDSPPTVAAIERRGPILDSLGPAR